MQRQSIYALMLVAAMSAGCAQSAQNNRASPEPLPPPAVEPTSIEPKSAELKPIEPIPVEPTPVAPIPIEPIPAPADFKSFGDVDYVWAQKPAQFSALWQRAHHETIRVAVFGDSQETSIGGAGYVYIPRLSYEAWRRYRNVPETQVVGFGSYGGGSPWGEWLLNGGAVAPTNPMTRVPSVKMLPGIWVVAHSSLNGAQNLTGQFNGQLTILRQDSVSVAPQAQLYDGTEYFCSRGAVHAQVFGATHPQSGEIRFLARPLDNANRGDFYAPATLDGRLNMDLAAPDFAIRAAATPQLNFNGHRYMQLEIAGTEDTALTDVIGMRFVSDSCKAGLVIQDFAAGGYTINDFLTKHFDAGAMFRAFEFHAAIIHLGANDAGRGVTARQHFEQVKQMIAMIRAWAGDSAFPIVLMTDPYRHNWPAEIAFEFDRYAGALLAVAEQDPNVMLVNSRRLMDDQGWNAAHPERVAEVLADAVHYTPKGAIELAAAEASALFGEP